MISLLSFLVVIAISVLIHESGHFLLARRCGVQVHEFSFGMGPPLFSRRRGETLWSIRAFPIGGFVRLAGMEEERGEEACDPERSFSSKGPWARFAILAAGSVANLLLAWGLTVLLLMGRGVMDLDSARIGELMPGYPAERIGLLPGDRITRIDGHAVTDWESMAKALKTAAERGPVELLVDRNGTELHFRTPVPLDPTHKARLLGIRPGLRRYGPLEAATNSFSYSFRMGWEILRSIGGLFLGRGSGEVTGPVGIATMAGDAARQGFWTFLSFLAVLNLHLGLLNLFPFPALDGGRLFFVLGEAIFRRKFPEQWENRIHYLGFLLLLAMILFVTWKDLIRLFGGRL
jgi:regulator of sigma E protease